MGTEEIPRKRIPARWGEHRVSLVARGTHVFVRTLLFIIFLLIIIIFTILLLFLLSLKGKITMTGNEESRVRRTTIGNARRMGC